MRLEINYKKKELNTHTHTNVEAKEYATNQPVNH